MRARKRSGESGIECRGYGFAIVDSDQVDVLAESPIWQVRSCQCGAADEVDTVSDGRAEKCKHVGNEVVALYLLGGDAELCCHAFAFVDVHV